MGLRLNSWPPRESLADSATPRVRNKQQAHINSFPHFTTNVEGFNIHFVALFSQKRDAIPLICLHGWPGSFLEWLRVLQLLTSKYSPETLPYHIIVPSLPGYGFSSPPPQDRDFGIAEVAGIMHQLMTGLGFDRYASQGGDIGAKVRPLSRLVSEAC